MIKTMQFLENEIEKLRQVDTKINTGDDFLTIKAKDSNFTQLQTYKFILDMMIDEKENSQWEEYAKVEQGAEAFDDKTYDAWANACSEEDYAFFN